MKREIELRRRLRGLEALGEAVSAMKSLSAHHFREARRAVEPARTYREGVERLLRGAGARFPAGTGGAGLLVIGAELGLCGSYNVRIVSAAAARRSELGDGPTFCVGHRAASRLARVGVASRQVYPAPTSVAGITTLLLRLAEDLMRCYADERLASLDIVSGRFAGVGHADPASVRLLPMETKGTSPPPGIRYVRPGRFATAAVREFLYVTLHGLILDAQAAEHGARLAATQAAEDWLDDRTQRLRRRLAAARREAGTQEVIEIAAGARARERRLRAERVKGATI